MKFKRILSFFNAIVLVATSVMIPTLTVSAAIDVWDGKMATVFASGTGAASDPYKITNGAELAYAINNSAADTYYMIANDIYLNDPGKVDWATGAYEGDAPNSWDYRDVSVQGHFNGGGNVVYGLYYNGNNGSIDGTNWGSFSEAVALFPEIADNTTLTLTGIGIDKAYISSKQGAGAFVGSKASSTATLATLSISECYVGGQT